MMNNGAMIESTTGIAQLGDVDPITFGLFAEYIYHGMYRIVPSDGQQVSPPSLTITYRIHCGPCGSTYDNEGDLLTHPKTCPSCGQLYVDVEDLTDGSFVYQNKQSYSGYHHYNNRPSNRSSTTKSTPNAFQALSYPALSKTHADTKRYLRTLHPPDPITIQVEKHAMVYVFAQRYMVEALSKLCLHKLHRDLMALTIGPTAIANVIDLLSYTYDNTASKGGSEGENSKSFASRTTKVVDVHNAGENNESDSDSQRPWDYGLSVKEKKRKRKQMEAEGIVFDDFGQPIYQDETTNKEQTQVLSVEPVGSELRTLVMTYAVCNAKKLLEYPEFCLMLQDGGEIVSDFMAGVGKRLTE